MKDDIEWEGGDDGFLGKRAVSDATRGRVVQQGGKVPAGGARVQLSLLLLLHLWLGVAPRLWGC